MTRLVARLVLAMMILPATGALFVIMFALLVRSGPPIAGQVLLLWGVIYAFDGVYWVLLWRSSVRWTRQWVWLTAASAPVAILAGSFIALFISLLASRIPAAISLLLAGGFPPVIWVLAAVLIWRETPEERIERLSASAHEAISCPVCGYNLTGLREAACPECGSAFTLDGLLRSQPSRDALTLSDE
jgi:hypothetical protein